MSDFEQTIATYLTCDGHVFLAPQYNIAFDKDLNEGGSCPDFVAFDLKAREIVVAEVTTAANLKPLFERVSDREKRWFNPIRRTLNAVGAINAGESWKAIRFLGFVRGPNLDLAKRAFAGQDDVTFVAIEQATFPWVYWEVRMRDGLPR